MSCLIQTRRRLVGEFYLPLSRVDSLVIKAVTNAKRFPRNLTVPTLPLGLLKYKSA